MTLLITWILGSVSRSCIAYSTKRIRQVVAKKSEMSSRRRQVYLEIFLVEAA